VRRIGIVVHLSRPGAVEAARELADWLRQRGVLTRSLEAEPVGADEVAAWSGFGSGLDLVLAVGGDGTLLRAAQVAAMSDVPVLGVKVGRLGFLTEVEPGEARDLLSHILEGTLVIEERMAVEAVPVAAPWSAPQWALNEVIVEKRARHRLITIRAQVDGEYVTTFSADGVIVATPTGSTAYSFSARGPIVSPKLECLLLTPVSPHMVFDRSLVLSPEEALTLEVIGEEPGLISADGRPGLELPVGARVRIQRAGRSARLVRRDGSPSFLSLLREKFSLPGEAPHGGTPRHSWDGDVGVGG
jgi:NAD+ kinase